jgi:hypothetical protein
MTNIETDLRRRDKQARKQIRGLSKEGRAK